MKLLPLIIVALLALIDPAMVRKINAAKAAAEEAFKKGDYTAAMRHYRYLVDSLGVTEDEVMLNLANASYLAADTATAFNSYQAVTDSPKPEIRSKAYQQLGLMANQRGRHEEALNLFKQAIKAAPHNDDARYNYEMLKKKLEEEKQQQQEQQQQNQDQQQQDQQKENQENKEQQQKSEDQQQQDNQEQSDEQSDQQQKDQQQQEQEQKEQQEQDSEEQDSEEPDDSDRRDMPNLDREKLNEMKMSEEKARMILEAMRNQEKQYLQQQKRKPTQSRDRNKPDW